MANQAPPVAQGPKRQPFYHLKQIQNNTISYLTALAQQGDFLRIPLGPASVYFVNNPDAVREVMVTQASKFHKPSNVKRAAEGLFGFNLFTTDGDTWRVLRKSMQPAFHAKRVNSYANVMVTHTHEMLDQWQDGETIDVPQALMTHTMGIATTTLFSADLRDNEAGDAIVRFIELFNERIAAPIQAPAWLPTPRNREFRDLLTVASDLLQPIINERRASGEDRGDVLSMLLKAQQEDETGILTDQQVHNEISNLFAAGYEVSPYTMVFTLYLISQHPKVEAKLQAEADQFGGRRLTIDDLPQLPYTEKVIKESMRLLPVTTVVGREATETTDVLGYTIKKGQLMLIAPWTLHRRPELYPDPERFDPERFDPALENEHNKYAYLPFATGPRICLGNAFAMLQLRLTLATIMQRFRLETNTDYEFEPVFRFNTRPKNGLPMIVHAR